MTRSIKKGFYVEPSLMKKVEKAQSSGDRKPIKTWSRKSTITPDFVGLNFTVHNGKGFLPVYVTENMVGHKLGEFSATRSFLVAQSTYSKVIVMQVKAYSKYARISPKKAREVARLLPGRKAGEAVSLLKYIPRKAARLLSKTLQSAMANAENNNNLNADDLQIEEAIVEDGPALKRFRPCARGSAHPYKKRMSHLRITLSDQ